jgi:signal transduction histidine kinase
LKDEKDFESALEYYNRSLVIDKKENNKRGISRDYGNIGVVYRHLCQWDSSLSCYERALAIDESINNMKGVSNQLSNLGIIYGLQKNYKKSLDCFLKALKINEELNDKEEIAIKLINIGSLYNNSGSYDTARIYIHKGINLAKEIKALSTIRDGYNYLVDVDSSVADYSSALLHFKEYNYYKDSITNIEKTKQIAEVKASYESEKKDQHIKMLDYENTLKDLSLKQKTDSILAIKLKETNVNSENALLKKNNELADLELISNKDQIDKFKSKNLLNQSQMDLLLKEKQLNLLEINQQRMIWKLTILSIILIILLAFMFINRYRQSQERRRLAERARISSDLHDDIGSSLSKIALISEMIKTNPEVAKHNIEKVINSSRDALEQLSNIVWSLNSRNDVLDNFIAYSRKYAVEYFEHSLIDCRVEVPTEIPKIPMTSEARRNIFLSMKEILHNVVKHSGATTVKMEFAIQGKELEVKVRDNGKGICKEKKQFGNGLINIQKRMNAIGGEFSIDSDNGTMALLKVELI